MPSAARRHAEPMLTPAAGLPLIKRTPTLGRMLEWRRGRSTYPKEYTEGQRKAHLLHDLDIFIKWMEKEDRAHYRGTYYFDKPSIHFEPRGPDTQYGDKDERGIRASRKVARQLSKDAPLESDYEDTLIWALFDVPEYITELPTDLALDLFAKGRPDLRPLREREWRNEGENRWSPR